MKPVLRQGSVLRQAGAIPFRQGAEGLEVLLITSRDTGRWVIPRGGIEKGATAAQTAEHEAYEEAGVQGSLIATPLGVFTYNKRLSHGVLRLASVEVYAMRVEKELRKWPEQAQRRLEWMPIAEAIERVQEQGMALLLTKLQQLHEASPAKI